MLKSLIVLLLVKCTEKDIGPMNLCGNNVEWCESIKYLGVYLQSGKCVKFNINATKRAFYAACNSIFMHSSGIKNDMTLLHLQKTYSLSVLLYAIRALLLTTRQVSELNACWNNVICRVFGYNKWESVSALLLSLERLNVKHLIMLRKIHFYKRLLFTSDIFIHNMFFTFLYNNCNDGILFKSVFLS